MVININCRWVCKHYGCQKASTLKKNCGIRKNQAVLPSGCNMQVLVSYSQVMGSYVVKTAKLEHNHPVGENELELYASQRRPTAELRGTAETS